MATLKEEISRRRTFAIISHPDAGKTTLTEKFLLYGGAIAQAGAVKGKKNSRAAVSDWMEIEKQRGISVTSSVMQFQHGGYCINILDTPGHQDFSEDTYRTLMAADSAVMVIDGAKGVEPQTRKLFKVCAMRHIPIFTFINKMDRESRDPFDLLDELENELGIETYACNWPIGSGKEFQGVYDRRAGQLLFFSGVSGKNRADKLEKEPAPLLISLVLYGIAATFIALLLERFGSWLLGRYFPENSTPYNVLMYFGVVAFSEEGAKYFLLKRRTWNSAAFNCQFDGVVYAVFVSLGFALWENISYVLMYGLSTALVRAVTAVPGHACFGVFMGVYYGRAKRYDNDGDLVNAKRCRTMAILMPALLHGAYDFIATMEDPNCEWVFLVFVLALFAVSLKLVRVGSRSDRYIDGGEGPLFF